MLEDAAAPAAGPGSTPRRAPRALRRLATAVLLALAAGAGALAPAAADGPPADAGYAPVGREVAGAGSIAQAPTVGPGTWTDTLALGSEDRSTAGTVRYYRVEAADGERLHASATLAAPPLSSSYGEDPLSLSARLSFVTATGRTCDDGGDRGVGEEATGDGPVVTSLRSGVVDPEDCPGPALYLKLDRTGPRDREDPLVVELRIAREPAGAVTGDPSIGEDDPLASDDGAAPVAPEDPDPTDLGRSLADPVRPGTGSVVVDLVPGEVGVLAVDVREGQRLRWRLETLEAGDEAGSLSMRVFSPTGAVVPVGAGSLRLGGPGTVSGGGMVAPLAPGNRDSGDGRIAGTWQPGEQAILLYRPQVLSGGELAPQEPVRLILTLEVEGEAVGGQDELLELGAGAGGGTWGPGRIALAVGAVVLGLTSTLAGGAGVALLVADRRARRRGAAGQALQASQSRA